MTPAATPLTFNAILKQDGFDLSKVLVFRHRPWEPALNKVFDWIVTERRDLFECYQSTHAANTESALKRADYVASFIRYKPRKALFVGLYARVGERFLSVDAYQARPLHRELMSFGMGGHKASDGRDAVLEFDLHASNWRANWSERLVVDWPGLERSWYRWADRNVFDISAILEDSPLRAPMPDWTDLVLSIQELAGLPNEWKLALAHWRGVYLIIDESDGAQYVGSAYGQANLLQRWLDYARTGHGGNKLLKARDPMNFRFSILQRVSPDLPADEIVEIEQSWKLRLRTRSPNGLNEN